MKFIITKILFLTAILNFSLNAQIVLTSAYNPAVGDAHYLRNVDEGEIIPGPSGANQFWDFSYIKAAPDSRMTYYILKCTTPYGMHFDKANLASHDGKWHFKYYNTTESFVQYLGSGDTTKVIVFTDAVLFLQYPFTYGNSFVDSFYSVFSFSEKIIKKSGIRFTIADGYGNIVLPTDTVLNVLRIKTTEIIIDSIFMNGNFVSVEQTLDTSYYWYKSDYKFPILVISFSYTSNGFIRYAGFVENPNTVGIQLTNSEIPRDFTLYQNFPNPFNPSTNIKFDLPKSEFVKIVIYNIIGQQVKILVNEYLQAGSYKISFDGSDIPSGVYFYRLIAGEFTETKKMLLIK